MVIEACGGLEHVDDKLLRAHTDGMYIRGNLASLPEATRARIDASRATLGMLKIEGEGRFKFDGMRKPELVDEEELRSLDEELLKYIS